MNSQVDTELLTGFVEETKPYLKLIPAHIEDYLRDGYPAEMIEEVFRLIHSIKGASSMMGLAMLSHLASKLELAAEEIGTNPGDVPASTMPLVQRTLQTIDRYLDACLAGDHDNTGEIAALLAAWENPELASEMPELPAPKRVESIRVETADSAEADETVIDEFAGLPTDDGMDEMPEFEADDIPEAPEETLSTDGWSEPNAGTEEIAPELLEIFGLEAEEHLRTITSRLPDLRDHPNAREIVQEIRRSAHTLKGSAAMVGFDKITHLAHRMEDLLDQMYEEGRATTPEILDILFKSTDLLEDLAAGRNRDAELNAIYGAYGVLLAAPQPVSSRDKAAPETLSDMVLPSPTVSQAPRSEVSSVAGPVSRRGGQYLRVPIEKIDALIKLVSELVISRSEFEQRLGSYLHQVDELQLSTARLRRASGKLETEYEAKSLGSGRSAAPSNPTTNSPLALTNYQSYGFDDLEFDRYTDFHLISRELSETTTDLHTLSGEFRSLKGDFDSYLTRQTRLSSELQDKLMRVRMVPLSTLGSRLERTVRNAADQCRKTAELLLEGENTELDKQVLEEMAEPLLHLLRNAVDHGLESGPERLRAGKPQQGCVRVRAFPEGTQIVLQVIDDGRGIDPQALRGSIVAKGFASSGAAEALTDEEAMNFLFQSGFSTASEISELSGRGVGLDIVRDMVLRLNGSVAIDSKIGAGTTFTIRLPLTLAVMRALLVKAGGQTFAIPLGAVSQIVRLEPEMLETLADSRVIHLNGKIHPIHHLTAALALKNPPDPGVKHPPVVIVRSAGREIALIVDQLQGGREIVVKNMGRHVRKLPGIAGATIMGDGSVVLIVNPNDIHGEKRPSPRIAAAKAPEREVKRDSDDRLKVMIVDDSPSVRRVVSTIFKRVEWESEAAKDGVEALEHLHRATALPDAIVLDIEMPRMDGYEFLSTLRSMDSFRDIPVVMVTSRAGDKHRRKAMEIGANAYLVKPYQDDLLIRTIRDMVRDAAEVTV